MLKQLSRWFCCITLLGVSLLSGCSTLTAQHGDSPIKPLFKAEALPEGRWRIFCINMPFDPEQTTRWSLDALIMDQVLAPELYREKEHIALWRFHRRSANDQAGHRLRFLVYANADSLQRIETSLQGNALLDSLQAAKLTRNLKSDCGGFNTDSSDIAATSDPHWSPELQAAWPYFAMGVSATLLDLIEQERKKFPVQERTLDEMLALYDHIQQSIDALWLKEGQHGFLHHLNALFAYQPIWLNQHSRF